MKKSYLLSAVCACTAIFSQFAQAVPVNGQGTWETTLQGRDLDGNAATFEAYYDTTLDITWLADANAAGTKMNWATANTWATTLDVNGVTGWRLPLVSPINGSTFNTTFSNDATTDLGYADSAGWVDSSGTPVSEMGYMFYVTLGNLGRCSPGVGGSASCTIQPGWGLTNTGPFLNIISSGGNDFYWTGQEYSPAYFWDFSFYNGLRNAHANGNNMYAWAVRSGDIDVVPLPATVWLFGGGLIGLLGLARRKKA